MRCPATRAARIRARLDAGREVQILPFASRYASDFKRLNLEWVHKYFRVEPVDEQVLSNPRATSFVPSGAISTSITCRSGVVAMRVE